MFVMGCRGSRDSIRAQALCNVVCSKATIASFSSLPSSRVAHDHGSPMGHFDWVTTRNVTIFSRGFKAKLLTQSRILDIIERCMRAVPACKRYMTFGGTSPGDVIVDGD